MVQWLRLHASNVGEAWAQSTCPELSAQGLVPLRWGKKLEIELPYDPAIPLLGIYTEETRRESGIALQAMQGKKALSSRGRGRLRGFLVYRIFRKIAGKVRISRVSWLFACRSGPMQS